MVQPKGRGQSRTRKRLAELLKDPISLPVCCATGYSAADRDRILAQEFFFKRGTFPHDVFCSDVKFQSELLSQLLRHEPKTERRRES